MRRMKSTPKRYMALVLSSIVLTVAYLRSGSSLGMLLPSTLQHQWKSTSSDYQQAGPVDATAGQVSSETKHGEDQPTPPTTSAANSADSPNTLPPTSRLSSPPKLAKEAPPQTFKPSPSTQSPGGKDTKQPEPEHGYTDNKATIVVALSGEMANNLMHIAHGIGLKQMAKDLYDIDCNLVLRHHVGPNNRAPKPKWKSARNNIQQCFPKLATWDFSEGNTPHFKKQEQKQLDWLGKDRYDYLTGLVNANNQTEIAQGLEYLATKLLKDPKRPKPKDDNKGNTIRLPYMLSQTLDAFPLIDKYYTQIREVMAFDNNKCCNQIPKENEYVFHYRNYQSELPRTRAYDMGFSELSPQKTAKELFGHLKKNAVGEKEQLVVAMTTRIPNQVARNQVEALEQENDKIHAYLVEDQSAVEDFCFLKESKTELVGNARSTYVFWAGLLSTTVKKVRLYHVDNWGLRNRHPNFYERFTYNWTHEELKERIQFELYQAEEMEEKQQN